MMPYHCKLHERAYEEYIEAYEWYELKQKGLGERFMEKVEKKLALIAGHPSILVKETVVTGKQRLTVFP